MKHIENTTISKLKQVFRHRDRQQMEADTRAAVNVVLRPCGQEKTEVLLIERTKRPDDPWSGQMAFPGGRADPNDPSLLDTALREAREEVGLDLTRAAFHIGTSDDVRAIARGRKLPLVITPFVFELKDDSLNPELLLQQDEVAGVLWAPIEEMASGRLSSTFTFTRADVGTIKLPSFKVNGKVIWGLTHTMLSNLFKILEKSPDP